MNSEALMVTTLTVHSYTHQERERERERERGERSPYDTTGFGSRPTHKRNRLTMSSLASLAARLAM